MALSFFPKEFRVLCSEYMVSRQYLDSIVVYVVYDEFKRYAFIDLGMALKNMSDFFRTFSKSFIGSLRLLKHIVHT